MMAGKGREYGLILCPTSPMFTNANGKRKCRKMRRPAGIPIMRRKIAFSAPVSCFLTGILFLFFSCFPASGMCLSATSFVAVSPAFVLSLLSPFPFFPFLFVFVLLPSSRLFLFSFFRERGGDPPFRLR